MTNIKVHRPLEYFKMLLGDFGVLENHNENKSFVLRKLLSSFLLVANILLNLYSAVEEVFAFNNLEVKLPQICITAFCLNIWTVIVLILHIEFRKKFQRRVILGLWQIDGRLKDFQLHFNYQLQKKTTTFVLVISLVFTVFQVVSKLFFLSAVQRVSWHFAVSFLLTNLSLCSVFLTVHASSRLITMRFRLVNVALARIFMNENPRPSLQKLLLVRRFRSTAADEDVVCKLAAIYQEIVSVAEGLNHCFSMQVNSVDWTLVDKFISNS